MKLQKLFATGSALALALSVFAVSPAQAAETVVVTPDNTQGWAEADTNAGGSVEFVADADSPLPEGALQLTTDGETASRAQYMHEADIALGDVTDLSYATKKVSGPETAAPSYQLQVDLNGTETNGGFTTLVYEPYWNGTVQIDTWQTWNVAADDAQLWSSRSFTDNANCTVVAGGGGQPFYNLAELQADCPDAEVVGFGVNVGTNNLNYVVETDAVVFNDTTYDFEQTKVNEPTLKDMCKKGGFEGLTDALGRSFRNQGQCVSYFNHMD